MSEDLEFKKSDFDYAGQERDLGKRARKVYKHRKLVKLHSPGDPLWAQLGDPDGFELSTLLGLADREPLQERIFLCGKLGEMTREYMGEPVWGAGWRISGEFAFKHRVAVYHRPERPDREISVRLISHRESWLPDCESMLTAIPAWRALESEWASTGLPLLSSPAATGKALLWETLPRDVEFPSLSDDLARLIRANSPQHRLEDFQMVSTAYNPQAAGFLKDCIQYDGRWMYASLCGLDRFPVGEPKRAGGFREYQPGIYNVRVGIPATWNHIGLLPLKGTLAGGAQIWGYPCAPGTEFITWAFEPELTLAIKHGWKIIEIYDGYSFDKGRPLLNWSNKLIEMRVALQERERWAEDEGAFPNPLPFRFAASAIRQILNHTIGAIHKNEYQRETFISKDNFKLWRRENPFQAEGDDVVEVEGGYIVPCFVPDNSRLSIFKPDWSATLYSLARARVAEWALLCDPSTLVKIHGDAIYSTIEQPELDKLDTQRLGQPRRKS